MVTNINIMRAYVLEREMPLNPCIVKVIESLDYVVMKSYICASVLLLLPFCKYHKAIHPMTLCHRILSPYINLFIY